MSSKLGIEIASSVVIECQQAGKCYKIYDSPKDRLKQAIWGRKRRYYRDFWALREVSFELAQGDSLGIIGRNGSGKSTLLQLVCGTVSATEGSIRTNGRIAALLELGSGFNPEFTGIENVYLNASMLGLSTEEIDSRIDDILAFADIGEFLSQPVKTYSSGMVVRLAFAVIANVDADILVVDEALAVGDAVFVQRCMRYIKRMRDERCLMFVSHDAEAVKSLCTKAIWLSKGRTMAYGTCKDVSLEYLRFCSAEMAQESVELKPIGHETKRASNFADRKTLDKYRYYSEELNMIGATRMAMEDNLSQADGWKTGGADLVSVKLRQLGSADDNINLLRGGEEVEIEIIARANMTLEKPAIGFTLANRFGQHLFGENTLITRETTEISSAYPGQILCARFRILFPLLPSGEYALMASVADGDLRNNIQHHWTENAVIIRVTSDRIRYGLVGTFLYDAILEVGPATGGF